MFNERFGLQQAVIAKYKTMTRRIINGDYEDVKAYHAFGGWIFIADTKDGDTIEIKPAYKVGEEVAIAQSYRDIYDEYLNDINNPIYEAYAKAKDDEVSGKGFENKMFVRADLMPHRIIIRKVDVQRIQDITEEDCTREGIQTDTKHFQEWQGQHGFRDRDKNVSLLFKSRREAFASLIAKVGKKSDWEDNPWVYVYTFELVR